MRTEEGVSVCIYSSVCESAKECELSGSKFNLAKKMERILHFSKYL